MIDCILRQTFPDWELILVDDQSIDNTQEIIKEYISKDQRIKMFVRDRQPKGSTTCRNIGFENSCGKYVIHFDADDLISDTCLEKRVAFMEANQEIDYASFPAKSFTSSSQLPIYKHREKTWGVKKYNDLLTSFLKCDYSFSVWNNIYKKKSIESFRWDENVKIYTDFSFIIPCILLGLRHQFSGLEEIDYFYHRFTNGQNMCSSFVTQDKCDSTIYLFSETLDKLKQRSDYKRRRREFAHFIILHFERLIVGGDKKNIEEYLLFCKKYYNLLYIILTIINKLSIQVENILFRKLLLYFQTTIFFFRRQSAVLFAMTLKHRR